jgi:hypothetical protein
MNVGMDSPASSQRFPAQPVPVSAGVLALGILALGGAGTVLSASSSPSLAAPSASSASSTAVQITAGRVPAPLPRLLSDTGYTAPGTLEYSPQYPLWSDGATKRRFVSIPKGEAIDASDPDAWRFPAGTRFWKEFSFGERVETRYLEKLPDGSFRFAAYVWDRALGDAVLAPETGQTKVHALADGVAHDVPSRSDCRACHEGRSSLVLGFNALQLSPDRDPLAPHVESLPAGAVDLRGLVERGLLRGLRPALLTTPPRISASSATARAAQGYLFGNCASCHNRTGPLASLGLDFDQSVVSDSPPSSVGQRSRFVVPGARGSLRIAPGRPHDSAVWFRMSVRNPSQQMPPLGSKLVDRAGLDLVARFIAQARNPHENQGKTP